MSNFTFANTSGGDWNTPGNWDPNGSPGSNDQVSFDSGTYTSVVDGSAWFIQSLDVDVTTVTLDVDVDLTTQTLAGNLGEIDVETGATFTVGSLNSSSGEIYISNNSTLTVQNLNGNYGNIVAGTNGLVQLEGTGSGNFSVSGGTLEIASNYNGSGTIAMNGGTVWVSGQLGNSSYTLDNGLADQVFFDSLQQTTNNAFIGADQGDTLAIKGGVIASATYSGTTLTLDMSSGADSTYVFTDIQLAADAVPKATFGTETFEGNSYGYIQLACFAKGTQIDTTDGPVAVEALHAGQLVLTAAGTPRPVRWVGYRHLDLRRHPNPGTAQPIRIMAGAFAPEVPRRDLLVSPAHALLVDGVLIPAQLLVNGATVWQEDACHQVTYFHVELDSHDVLLAEGLAAESYLDTGNRGMFENAALPLTLYPDLDGSNDQFRRAAESCAPFVADADGVYPVWKKLADRASALGLRGPEVATTEDPELRLEIGGRQLKPVTKKAGRHIFLLPRTDCPVRLVSHAIAPSELRPWIGDQRQLGVAVRCLTLRRDGDVTTIPLDHPGIGKGWWGVEHDAATQWRWTDGVADLVLEPGGPALLEVDFGAMSAYRIPEPAALSSPVHQAMRRSGR